MKRAVKMLAAEIFMCGLKRIPFVGPAIEVIEGVQQRYESFEQSQRLAAIDDKLSGFETRLRDLVQEEIREVVAGLRAPDLDGPALTRHIRSLREIQENGWQPALFEGLLNNSPHWDELLCNPQHYGRFLGERDELNPNAINLLIDRDKTRILELTPFAFHALLADQKSAAPQPRIVTGQDIWALPPAAAAVPEFEPFPTEVTIDVPGQLSIGPQVREPNGIFKFTKLARTPGRVIPRPGYAYMLEVDKGVPDAGLAELAKLAGFSGLHVLDISDCRDATDRAVAHIRGLTQLRSLMLGSDWWKQIKLTDRGLAGLRGLGNLVVLNLFGCEAITDAGLEHVGHLMKLQKLALQGCRGVTGSGLAHLARLQQLRELSLGTTQVADASLPHLRLLTNLHYLVLTGQPITDAGLEALATLTNLTELVLNMCGRLTAGGVARLRKALPNCKVSY